MSAFTHTNGPTVEIPQPIYLFGLFQGDSQDVFHWCLR